LVDAAPRRRPLVPRGRIVEPRAPRRLRIASERSRSSTTTPRSAATSTSPRSTPTTVSSCCWSRRMRSGRWSPRVGHIARLAASAAARACL